MLSNQSADVMFPNYLGFTDRPADSAVSGDDRNAYAQLGNWNLEANEICSVCITYRPDKNFAARVAAVLPQVDKVIIVDIGSSSAELQMLLWLAESERVCLLFNQKHLGIASALNMGVDHAARLGYRAVVLLDQDTWAYPDMVSSLLGARRSYPRPESIALIGAHDEQSIRGASEITEQDWPESEYVISAGTLVDIQAYRRVGGFRDEFFMDCVDVDYCARARDKGYQVIRTHRPLMREVHRLFDKARWVDNHTDDLRYYHARNDTVLLRESHRFPQWRLKSLRRSLQACRQIIQSEDRKLSKSLAVLEGWLDGLKGQLGPRGSHTVQGGRA